MIRLFPKFVIQKISERVFTIVTLQHTAIVQNVLSLLTQLTAWVLSRKVIWPCDALSLLAPVHFAHQTCMHRTWSIYLTAVRPRFAHNFCDVPNDASSSFRISYYCAAQCFHIQSWLRKQPFFSLQLSFLYNIDECVDC